jgi:hypothetical protein
MPYVGVRTPSKAVRNALRYRNFFLWKLPHIPSQWPRSLHRRPPSWSLKLLFVRFTFGRTPRACFLRIRSSVDDIRLLVEGGPFGSDMALWIPYRLFPDLDHSVYFRRRCLACLE